MSWSPGSLALVLVNLLAFATFGWDKNRARRRARRVPEARLLLLAGLLGFPGAWLGVGVFRHKTRKPSFLAKLVAVTVLDLALVGLSLAYVR